MNIHENIFSLNSGRAGGKNVQPGSTETDNIDNILIKEKLIYFCLSWQQRTANDSGLFKSLPLSLVIDNIDNIDKDERLLIWASGEL